MKGLYAPMPRRPDVRVLFVAHPLYVVCVNPICYRIVNIVYRHVILMYAKKVVLIK